MNKNQREALHNFNSVFSQFLTYIEKRASSYKPNGFGKEDLIQEGLIGLLSAVHTYKEDKGASFSAYAKKCISNRMNSFIRGHLSLKNKPLSGYTSLEEEPLFSESDPAEKVQEKEALEAFKDKLSEALSEKEKSVLEFYLNGSSIKAIAALEKTEEKSVQNTLYRIRRKIKNFM